jgi:hypothetical protein
LVLKIELKSPHSETFGHKSFQLSSQTICFLVLMASEAKVAEIPEIALVRP